MNLKSSTVAVVLSGVVSAVSTVPAQAEEFEYSASLYGWMAGLGVEVETDQGTASSDLSFSEILEDLDGAFMGAFEARRGRLILLGDIQYTATKSRDDSPFGVAYSDIEAKTKLKIASAFVMYRQIDQPDLTVDLGAGLRYASVELDVRLSPGLLPEKKVSTDDSWIDPVLIARFEKALGNDWSVTGLADIGGFGVGSNLTWQAMLGASYEFNDRWTGRVAYRHMHFDRSNGSRDFKLDLSGPIVGVTYNF